jgi:hypothetical protein
MEASAGATRIALSADDVARLNSLTEHVGVQGNRCYELSVYPGPAG